MKFEKLPKLVDLRGKTKRKGSYTDYGVACKTDIAIHHSLTKVGSSAAFANYHAGTLGWPGVAYHFVIKKDGTIEWNHNLGVKSYHVGNSNKFAVGICVVGDFRSEKPTEAQKDSLALLVAALKGDMPNYKRTRGHNEFPGYSWKACPVFDYRAVVNRAPEIAHVPAKSLPNKYVIQEGDTFYSIAKEHSGMTVESLLAANPGVKASALKIGQTINLTKAPAVKPAPAKPKPVAKPSAKPTVRYPLPDGVYRVGSKGAAVKQIQNALNAANFKCGAADGVYGAKTADAVRRFQSMYAGLKADGIFGPNTKKKLAEVLRK